MPRYTISISDSMKVVVFSIISVALIKVILPRL